MSRDANSRDAHSRVVILGAGFGGLACAKALGSSGIDVTIVDRNNYHLFVPLLYQVATAALSPADIAQPIRRLLRKHDNIRVIMDEVTGVDTAGRRVELGDGTALHYDVLVIATGSQYNYFGHAEWEKHAPGLKTIEDARHLRSRLLGAFERAERADSQQEQAALMTTVIVGGGPTGVEVAGAVAELTRYTLAHDFRRIDPAHARTILIEAGPRILGTFPEDLSAYARAELEKLGVEIHCDTAVEDLGDGRVMLADREISAGTVIWGAGIKASPAARWLGVEPDKTGRVRVGPDLAVPGLSQVYIIGDSALALDEATGDPLPGLAQVAQQQGRHLGAALRLYMQQGMPVSPFHYRDRGNTAIVGRNAAVFDFGKRKLRGSVAWMLWAIVHIYLLAGFEKRFLVSLQWAWRYLTYQRGARLITGGEPLQRQVEDGAV